MHYRKRCITGASVVRVTIHFLVNLAKRRYLQLPEFPYCTASATVIDTSFPRCASAGGYESCQSGPAPMGYPRTVFMYMHNSIYVIHYAGLICDRNVIKALTVRVSCASRKSLATERIFSNIGDRSKLAYGS